MKKRENSVESKFFCDSMLGKLSRELRILGVDAECKRGQSGMRAYRLARGQGRILLTRNTRLRELPGVFFIRSQVLSEQLAEVKQQFGISPRKEQTLTRCLECNVTLEKITREQARPSVPFFIYQIHHDFRRCPKCKRVYWPGSHTRNMERRVSGPRGNQR